MFGFLALSGQRDSIYFEKDTLQIELRTFDESRIKNYQKEPRFNFTQNPKYEENFLSRAFMRAMEWLSKTLGSSVSRFLLKFLFYAVIFLGAAFLLYHFLKTENGPLFQKEDSKKVKITAETVDETTGKDQIQKLIDSAIAAGEYRVAVRLLFLKTLRGLDDKALIKWKKGKTNSDYVSELTDKKIKSSFQEATRIYEYVWYGEFELESKDEFKTIHQQFQQLFTNIASNVG